jgi:hypothetical protein
MLSGQINYNKIKYVINNISRFKTGFRHGIITLYAAVILKIILETTNTTGNIFSKTLVKKQFMLRIVNVS